MKIIELESTYLCQINKPENRAILEEFIRRRDSSGAELVRYYLALTNMLRNTPAWGRPGVIAMLNELCAAMRAVLNHEKRGKTTAYAHANKLLNKLKYFANQEVSGRYAVVTEPFQALSETELLQLALI